MIELTEQQKYAINCDAKNLAILAAAGSGKTSVLTERICRMIDEGKAMPDEVVALTFTAKAAGEMKNRVTARLKEKGKDITIKTFHSFGLQLLRTYYLEAHLSEKFEVVSPGVRSKYVERAVKESGYTTAIPLPNSLSFNEKRDITFAEARALISKIKNGTITCPKEFTAAFDAYNRILYSANQIDVDDMVWRTVNALRTNTSIRDEVSSRYRFIFIDEFQDINRIQNEFVSLLLTEKSSVCVVGDDDQCIYEWRGSRPEYIQSLAKREDFECVYLTKNFRSQEHIIEIANRLISRNKVRVEKEMEPQVKALSYPELYYAPDETEEANLIAQIIHKLCVENSYSYGQIAILTRIGKQMSPICDALERYSIPYSKNTTEEDNNFLELLHVLYAIQAPTYGNNLSKAINYPDIALDTFTYQDICEEKDWSGLPASKGFQHIMEDESISWLGREKFSKRYNLIMALNEEVNDENPATAIGIIEKLRESIDGQADEKLKEKLNSIQQALYIATEWSATTGETELSDFLDYVSCAMANDEISTENDTDTDAVKIMTCHKSKGLEFPIVFVPGVQLGLFPITKYMENEQDLEAERRLLYVAITRAKERLIITNYGGWTIPSNSVVRQSFIADMPELVMWRKERKEKARQLHSLPSSVMEDSEKFDYSEVLSIRTEPKEYPSLDYPDDSRYDDSEACFDGYDTGFSLNVEASSGKVCYANCSDCPREKAGLGCVLE